MIERDVGERPPPALLAGYEWEGAYPVPDLALPACPWCRRLAADWFVVVHSQNGEVRSEIVCGACVAHAPDYIRKRRAGWTHREALRDYGFRT